MSSAAKTGIGPVRQQKHTSVLTLYHSCADQSQPSDSPRQSRHPVPHDRFGQARTPCYRRRDARDGTCLILGDFELDAGSAIMRNERSADQVIGEVANALRACEQLGLGQAITSVGCLDDRRRP